MTLYLSGPMTGIPDFNFPEFRRVASIWRAAGYAVANPAENFDGDTGLPRPLYMRKDIEELLTCQAVIVLPGWEKSQGARLEVAIARSLAMPVWDATQIAPLRYVSTPVKLRCKRLTGLSTLTGKVTTAIRQTISRAQDACGRRFWA